MDDLATAGDACDCFSPTGIFKRHADDDVHGFLAEKLTSSGFVLHHTAVLAAAFESFARADFVERLRAAYRILRWRHLITTLHAPTLSCSHMKFGEVSEEISESYERWQDKEPRVINNTLLRTAR